MCLEIEKEKRREEERQTVLQSDRLWKHILCHVLQPASWLNVFFSTMLFSFALSLNYLYRHIKHMNFKLQPVYEALSSQLSTVWHIFLSVCSYEFVYGCKCLKIPQNTGTNNATLCMFSFEPPLQKLSFLLCLISSTHFGLFLKCSIEVPLGKMIRLTNAKHWQKGNSANLCIYICLQRELLPNFFHSKLLPK